MLQRIQSLFLVLAAACIFSLFGLPFATHGHSEYTTQFFADSRFKILDHPALLGISIGVGVLALITIFLFNNRPLQIRMGYITIGLAIVLVVVGGLLYMQDARAAGEALSPVVGLGIGAPILAIIFVGLANRFISKDEKLVRSKDRLR